MNDMNQQINDFLSKQIRNYDPTKKESSVALAQATALFKSSLEDIKTQLDYEQSQQQIAWEREKQELENQAADSRENKRLIGSIVTGAGGILAGAAGIGGLVLGFKQLEAQKQLVGSAVKLEENDIISGSTNRSLVSNLTNNLFKKGGH